MTLKPIYKKIKTVYIYEIICKYTSERYIGSTTNIIKRKNSHKKMSAKTASVSIINRSNWTLNIIEKFNTKFKLVQLLKEQWYLDNFPNINMKRALTINMMKIKEKRKSDKRYYTNNKDDIEIKKTIYRKTIYKDRKNLLDKQWRNKNKETINLKNKNNIYICECGSEIRRDSKSKHNRSQKHINYTSSKTAS